MSYRNWDHCQNWFKVLPKSDSQLGISPKLDSQSRVSPKLDFRFPTSGNWESDWDRAGPIGKITKIGIPDSRKHEWRNLTDRITRKSAKNANSLQNEAHHNSVLSVAWHPLGHRFASAGMDNYVKIWSIGEGSSVQRSLEASKAFHPQKWDMSLDTKILWRVPGGTDSQTPVASQARITKSDSGRA